MSAKLKESITIPYMPITTSPAELTSKMTRFETQVESGELLEEGSDYMRNIELGYYLASGVALYYQELGEALKSGDATRIREATNLVVQFGWALTGNLPERRGFCGKWGIRLGELGPQDVRRDTVVDNWIALGNALGNPPRG